MLNLPPIYPITSASREDSLSAQVRAFGAAGFPLVQFRGKPLDAKAQWEELRAALGEAAEGGGWPQVVVNDRADLAVLAAAEGLAPWGLHLGQEDLPPQEALRLPGLEGLHFGASTHGEGEWSRLDPAFDHAGVGPLRATSTKADHAPPIGLKRLALGCHALRGRGVSPVAIGAVGLGDARACFEAGAESLAMVGALDPPADPAQVLWNAQLSRWRCRPPVLRGQGVLLAGSSGAGKSAFAEALAARAELPAIDLDLRIAEQTGQCIPEIFANLGESAFREMEASHLEACLRTPAVVALGGGAWETAGVRTLAEASGFAVLWLAERPELCWARAGGDPDRPLAASRTGFMARHRARIARWSTLPCVLPLGRSPEALAAALVDGLD